MRADTDRIRGSSAGESESKSSKSEDGGYGKSSKSDSDSSTRARPSFGRSSMDKQARPLEVVPETFETHPIKLKLQKIYSENVIKVSKKVNICTNGYPGTKNS